MILLATVTVFFLYPETRGLAMEDAPNVFKHHWFWKRYASRPDADRARDQELLAAASFRSDGTPLHPDAHLPNGTAHANGSREIEVRGSPFHGAPFADYPFAEDEPEAHGHSDPTTTNLYLAAQAKGRGGAKGAKPQRDGGVGFRDNPFATSAGTQNGSPGAAGRADGGLHAYEDPADGEIASLEVVPEPASHTPRSRLAHRTPASDDPIWQDD